MTPLRNRIGPVAYRAATCPLRMMPTFVVIGAHRGGTSAFYHYLTEHPCIGAATTKEINFFDKKFHKGPWWYRAHFPSLTYQRYAEVTRHSVFITGEASPHYMFHPLVPQRVARTLPQVKLIALLRNPVERAYSQYRRYVYLNWETASFADAVVDERQRLDAITRAGATVGDNPDDVLGRRSSLARGLYVDQLRRWLDVFPRKQVLILRSEDFYADPAAVLDEALAFLDVPLGQLPVTTEYGRFDGYASSHEARGETTIDPDVREEVSAYFAPYNQRLYELIGRDMDWW